jgi:drug/metabolite transporter (DMT)-like permease
MILGSVSVLISSVLGILFFQEGLSTVKFAGIGLILISLIVLNFNRGERLSKYNFLPLAGGVCFGIAYSIDKSFVSNLSPFAYLPLMCFTVAAISLIVRPQLILNETKLLNISVLKSMVLAAAFGSLFNLFTFLAYQNGGNVGVMDAMNNSTVFMIILGEIVFLRDVSNLKKKVFCASLALIGVGLFSML